MQLFYFFLVFTLLALLFPISANAEREPAVYNQTEFSKLGFPSPQNPVPVTLSGTLYSNWKTYLMQHAVKADTFTDVDAGMIGTWAWIESNFNPYNDNCAGLDKNPNTPCYASVYSWQVGYGVHLGHHIGDLKEAMEKMRPGKSPQEVGQAVIDAASSRSDIKITYPESTFPNTTIETIMKKAQEGDVEMRSRVATLMKDDAIGAYLVAKRFKQIGLNGNLAWTMSAWPPYGYYDRHKIINRIKAVYDKELLIPISETLTPYVPSDTSPETSNGWKNTLIEVRKPLELKQVAFFNAGGNHSYEIRRSSLSGELTGSLIISGKLEEAPSSKEYYFASLPYFPISPGYYIFRVYIPSGNTSFSGENAKLFEDISFLKKSEGSLSATKSGSYKIRFIYINTY